MSKDKHKGVERRKFALANLPGVDGGKRHVQLGYLGEPNARNGYRRRDRVDITADLRRLEKEGKVTRKRSHRWAGNCAHTFFCANTKVTNTPAK